MPPTAACCPPRPTGRLDVGRLRGCVHRYDVLPIIPLFNLACALGVPFVDKTVRVEDVGKSIVAGLLDEGVSGVQRYPDIERLAATIEG